MQKKMLFLTFALGACCALPSVVPAAPEAKGEIVKTLEFTDQNGQNSVVLRLTGEFARPEDRPESDANRAEHSRELFAECFVEKDGQQKQVWRVYDFIHGCPFHLRLGFFPDLAAVTDLDRDGVFEVWLPYYGACQSDITPPGMKIIMYEGGQKHAVRGEAHHPEVPDSGRYQADAAFKKAPQSFRRYADELWQQMLKAESQLDYNTM